MIKYFIPVILILFIFNSGCLNEASESLFAEPGVINYVKTCDINRYINIAGIDTLGNSTETTSNYDLNFYHVGSTEVFGVKSGFFNDQFSNRTSLKFMDLGIKKFELIEHVPENGKTDADYKEISTERKFTDIEDGEHTLFKLNHIYSIYKWNPQGGNYLKIIIQQIEKDIARVQIRGTYQRRQGVTLVSPSDVPY